MAPQTAKENGSAVLPPKYLRLSVGKSASFLMAQILLRTFAAAFTLVSIAIMLSSSQSIVLFGFTFSARYSYSSGLRFLLGANAVVCAFSVLSLIFACLLSRLGGSELKNHFFLYLHDMVMMVLMISGCAAATAVGYVSRYGEEKMGWMAVCNRVEKFCNMMLISMVLSYLAFFSYLGLTVLATKKFMDQVTG